MQANPNPSGDDAEPVAGPAQSSPIPGAAPASAAAGLSSPSPGGDGRGEGGPPLTDFIAVVAAALKARGFWSLTITAEGVAEMEADNRATHRTADWTSVLDTLDLYEVEEGNAS